MLDFKNIDEITRKLTAALPPGLADIRHDMQSQFRDILQAALERMDLVTREEFDVQVAVLQRSQEKLRRLEQQLAGDDEQE